MDQQPDVVGFYDAPTGSIQYIVTDPSTRRCTVVDPVLDYDPRSGSTRTTSADGLLRYIETHELTLEWILDTHPHADHFSAAGYLKDSSGATTAIGERVKEVQRLWKKLYNLSDNMLARGGNLCIQIFREAGTDAMTAQAEQAAASLGGRLDGEAERVLVATIPVRLGFTKIERVIQDLVDKFPGAQWYYGNVYDPVDGITPLNWWLETESDSKKN